MATILRRADVADVVALATKPGPVQLYPALKVEPRRPQRLGAEEHREIERGCLPARTAIGQRRACARAGAGFAF